MPDFVVHFENGRISGFSSAGLNEVDIVQVQRLLLFMMSQEEEKTEEKKEEKKKADPP